MTESGNDKTSAKAETSASWYRIAVATAVVGAAFSLIVCVFMAANYGRSRVIDTPAELELLALRAEIPDRPDEDRSERVQSFARAGAVICFSEVSSCF